MGHGNLCPCWGMLNDCNTVQTAAHDYNYNLQYLAGVLWGYHQYPRLSGTGLGDTRSSGANRGGMHACSGGLVGMGENLTQRAELVSRNW